MFSLLIHLIGLALLKADQVPLNNGADAAHLCCNTLSEKLPSKVHFPGSVEYERQQYSHFLLQQADMQPSCRVSPTSSSEVSLIMKTVTEHSCPFAVRSGGHSTWPGSNVQGGVALDLGLLNSIDVDEEKGVAQLGPGCKWKNVYAAMEQYNVTTVGGRMPDVGIGGFFLGGGISLLSFRHGFGSDNVINYEVVLADGTAVSANAASHPDLFWALKLGSTNFGIVTRFDVLTYPVKEVWGGIRTYPVTSEQTPKLIENWVSFARGAATTREELQALIIGRWRKGGVDEIATIWHASLDSVPGPPLTDTPPIDDSTRTTTFLNLIDDLQSSDFADKKRNKWDAFTIKMDAPTIWDVFNGAKRTFDKLEHVSGMQWDVAFQPITQGFLTASEKTGGNPFRKVLMESGDDLALISFLVSWKDAADDETMYKAIAELGAWSEELATQRGILNNFIYLNYASGEKPVYARSLSKEDMTRMKSVKRTYDADDVLGRLWKGGFKLPKDVPETIFESSASTEL
ncbi:FAD-binding domain-containing protein [Dendrothele bispora CBS 962.96]|uniref:FAD-binding domain-containing protein n=1 Tax=Dendrothele bispora (strain CBS 962.96) TaxID=1314807 RepID=A0A4S8KU35_DENBC|nr:FAD-binding domain-containing protein [Dendrothele bispora CBS 962.96]